MPNSNYYLSFDFETSSVNPHTTQILSVGAVVVHPKKLEIVPGSEFYSKVRPEDPSRVEAKALEVNRLTMEELMEAPPIEAVWPRFASYIKSYNNGKTIFTAPIPMGYNIVSFDLVILDRMARRFKNVDGEGTPNLFHFRDKMDLITDMFRWTEYRSDIKSLSFDNMRKWLGMSGGNAHNALQDSIDAANLGIRILKLHRHLSPSVQFENAFNRNNVQNK